MGAEHLMKLSMMQGPKSFEQGDLNKKSGDTNEDATTVIQPEDAKASANPEAPTAPENIHPAAAPDNHTKSVTRVDDMEKKLRLSVEKAKAEIRPVREGVTLDHSFTHHSSSSDYASSSGDSAGKPQANRTRRITNDGILELKASPLKVGPARVPLKDHRRKVSLKLPINVSSSQRSYPHPSTQHTHSLSISTEDSAVAPYEAEECELEYKHRHIFVGTASLDDFLEILEVGHTYTTTKRQVAKAFGKFITGNKTRCKDHTDSQK